ncbi:MAG: glycosyltransferase family 39 protein [Candidatus Omnitrophota bacterium]
MRIKKYLALILSLAFVVRVIAIFLLGRHINPESWEFNDIALNIIHGRGYVFDWLNTQYHSFGYPLYPFLLAISHTITHENYFILEIFNAVVSCATCYVIYLIAGRIFNKRVGLLSAFLTATHPGLIVYATKIHEFTLVTFLTVLIIWSMIRLNTKKAMHNFYIGSIIGIGVLTRPTFIFFFPAYFVYLWVSSRDFKNVSRNAAIAFLAIMLVILPWTIRNYSTHKRLIFITTNTAEHFWRGNNPNASGTALTTDGKHMLEVAPKEFVERLFKLDEMGQYDLFYGEALKFIKANPALSIKMFFRKFYYFWWFSPQTGYLYPAQWTVIYKIYYSLIFGLFLFGIYLSLVKPYPLDKSPVILILTFFIALSMAHSIYFMDMRHRWAIEPLMMIFSAYSVVLLLERRKTGCLLKSNLI